MTLGLMLKIVARKKPLVTLALGLAVVSMVSTAIIQSAGILQSTGSLAEKLLRPREKLNVTVPCRDPCIRQCTVTIRTSAEEAETTLTIIPQGVKGIVAPPRNGVGAGYILAGDLGLHKGDNITITSGDITASVEVSGIYRSGSPLDTGLVAGGGFEWCNTTRLSLTRESPTHYTRAFTWEVEALITYWALAGLLVLGLGSVVAGVKAVMDLEGEAGTLIAEGGSPNSLLGALSLFFALAVLAGYGWGLILTDLLDSLVAGVTGLYVPRASLSPQAFLVEGVFPALLVGLLVYTVGRVYGVREGKAGF